MAARTRQLAQMAQALMALAGERDVAVGAGRCRWRCGALCCAAGQRAGHAAGRHPVASCLPERAHSSLLPTTHNRWC